ncbi:G2/mitotic-specific cyclin-B-like [Corticium candelabrum]|uniref:G2/mitotic-specific cyclin-B-like n=1 Tax=Corticium candelabrum TaxID=121492 RepID=UPI002E2674FE|nr:G2/mitotic-specific cyclin-B-like [Corticium candelabrum]
MAQQRSPKDAETASPYQVTRRIPFAQRLVEQATEDYVEQAFKQHAAESRKVALVSKREPPSLKTTSHNTFASVSKQPVSEVTVEDPQLCLVYKKDILVNMLKLEQAPCYIVKENFILALQREVTPRMRTLLLDWLHAVHVRFNLLQETYNLCVDLIDRSIQTLAIAKTNFQLLGVTCMHVAAKFEEIYPPTIDDYVYVTDNTYSAQEIRKQEILVLKSLHYRISRPLAIQFLRQLSAEGNASVVEHNMAKFLLDVSIMDQKVASCLPSQRAAAALLLAVRILKREGRMQSLRIDKALSLFCLVPSPSPTSVRKQVAALAEQFLSALRWMRKSRYKSVFEKYSGSRYYHVSDVKAVKEL